MIDIEAKVRALLVGLPKVTAIFGARVYATRSMPPSYKTELGPGLLFTIRGGGQRYHSQAFDPSIQFRTYAASEAKAREAAGLLYDAINDTQGRGFAYIRMEDGTFPTLLNEPETNWPYVMSYFKFQVLNT